MIAIVAVLLVGCATSRQADSATPDSSSMIQYFVALLYSGPARDADDAEIQRIQVAHRNRIRELIDSGEMVLAGPFGDGGELRGLFVYDVASMAEAEALAGSDPAIQAGRLRAEIHPWWGLRSLRDLGKTR